MAGFRKKRLEEQVKRIIGDTLIKEVKDPRIGFVSVYNVELDDDYTTAVVHVSVLGDEKQKKKSVAGLNAAKGYIRSFLGKNLKTRLVPNLIFKLDTTIEDGVNLVNLIDEVNPDEKTGNN